MNLIYLISRKWSADILDQIIEKKNFKFENKSFCNSKNYNKKFMIIAISFIKEKNLIKNIKSIKNLIRKLFLLMDGVDILIKN